MRLIFLCLISSFVASCGQSPLFNHSKEEEQGVFRSLVRLENGLVLKNQKAKINLYWKIGPVVFDECQLMAVVTNQQGQLIDLSGAIELAPWMPDHGHGTSPVIVEKIDRGTYLFKEIYFIMPGRWEMVFTVDGESLKWDEQL